METYQHNQVKLCIGAALSEIGRRENLGLYFTDGFRVTLRGCTRCFLPDGCFVTYRRLGRHRGPSVRFAVPHAESRLATPEALASHGDKLRAGPMVVFSHGKRLTYTGLYGVPDVLIEVASLSNLDLDYYVKSQEYARRGVPEFWLLTPDGPSYRLLIFRLDRKRGVYPNVVWRPNRWSYSPTFRRSFRLLCLPSIDARLPVYELRQKSGARSQKSEDRRWRSDADAFSNPKGPSSLSPKGAAFNSQGREPLERAPPSQKP